MDEHKGSGLLPYIRRPDPDRRFRLPSVAHNNAVYSKNTLKPALQSFHFIPYFSGLAFGRYMWI